MQAVLGVDLNYFGAAIGFGGDELACLLYTSDAADE